MAARRGLSDNENKLEKMMSSKKRRTTRRRFAPSLVALSVAATTLGVAAPSLAQSNDAPEAVQFSLEQLQPADGFFITEPWVGLHNGDFDLFDLGERASAGLESLAEGGNTELLGSEFAQPGRLQATIGNGEVQFISPGETIEGSIDIRLSLIHI